MSKKIDTEVIVIDRNASEICMGAEGILFELKKPNVWWPKQKNPNEDKQKDKLEHDEENKNNIDTTSTTPGMGF